MLYTRLCCIGSAKQTRFDIIDWITCFLRREKGTKRFRFVFSRFFELRFRKCASHSWPPIGNLTWSKSRQNFDFRHFFALTAVCSLPGAALLVGNPTVTYLFLKIGHSRLLFSLYLSYQYSSQQTMFNIKFADDWMRYADLWCWKRLFYQLSHDNYPLGSTQHTLVRTNMIMTWRFIGK